MNFESNRRIEVARTEEEMYEKLEQLKAQGYEESDIHVVSKEHTHMNTLNRHSDVSTHEAGTLMDKFKSWFTGEDAVNESFRKLNLNDAETERYSKDVASGGFVLYTDGVKSDAHQNEFEEGYDTFGSTGNSYESYHGEQRPVQPTEPGFEDKTKVEGTMNHTTAHSAGTEFVNSRFNETETTENAQYTYVNESTTFGAEEPRSTYAKEQGFEPSTNDYVNKTDGRFDEPQDRFTRGETFATDPYLTREVDHIGHSTQEDKMVQQHRPTVQDSITNEQQTDGYQSPGADPNLGPAAFGSDISNEMPSGEMKHDFEKDPRSKEEQIFGTEFTSGKHNEPTNTLEDKKLDKFRSSENDELDTGYESNGHGNAFAFDTNSKDNEVMSGGVDEDAEDVTTTDYEERLDKDKYLREVPPNTKLF